MFAYITGLVEEQYENSVVIDVNGIGYLIHTTASTLRNVKGIGDTVKLYTYLYVREDALTLYGFYTKDEKSMFERLISVTGVGPKVALGILSTLSAADLALAIVTDNVRLLTKAPGVGKKTAHRLILELKEKIEKHELLDTSAGKPFIEGDSRLQEAILALIALGYDRAEAVRAMESIESVDMTVEEMILQALKRIDHRRGSR
ncbi:MAG: Holliday junction branch migration protein RuvA [Clostridia bacterium]|jgi:Holliday junction DNA helicase RuvA